MKVIYAILATAGWVWLAVVFVYMWVRLKKPRSHIGRGFEVVAQENGASAREHEEQR